jgi:hypothetical protein
MNSAFFQKDYIRRVIDGDKKVVPEN